MNLLHYNSKNKWIEVIWNPEAHTYVNFHTIMLGRRCCELWNCEGKQVCRHLWCRIKSSGLPLVIYNRRTWGSENKAHTHTSERIFFFLWPETTKSPCTRQKQHYFTWLFPISHSNRVPSVDNGDGEHWFHFWFVKTRKHFPGMCWFHLSSCKISLKRQDFHYLSDSQKAIWIS